VICAARAPRTTIAIESRAGDTRAGVIVPSPKQAVFARPRSPRHASCEDVPTFLVRFAMSSESVLTLRASNEPVRGQCRVRETPSTRRDGGFVRDRARSRALERAMHARRALRRRLDRSLTKSWTSSSRARVVVVVARVPLRREKADGGGAVAVETTGESHHKHGLAMPNDPCVNAFARLRHSKRFRRYFTSSLRRACARWSNAARVDR